MSEDTPTILDLVASIPVSPVDLWQVTVWIANESYGAVEPLTFCYHSNSLYDEVFPGEGRKRIGGLPIVDQWLIYDSRGCLGRRDGWSKLTTWITERSEDGSLLNRYFADAESAHESLEKALLSRVERLQGEIKEVTAKIQRLETRKREKRRHVQ